MIKKQVSIPLSIYDSVEELPTDVQTLMARAKKARNMAYAPYSKFSVGAALLLENGEIVIGNNQENAAYPSGMCAERVAVWRANAEFPHLKILKVAITASSKNNKVTKPVGPCGACRQALLEYEVLQEQQMDVYFMGEIGNVYKTDSILDLLPLAFDKSFL